MSAHVMEKDHIDALATVAMFGPADNAREARPGTVWYPPTWRITPDGRDALDPRVDHDLIGSLLWQENVLSVAYRYSETPANLPGPVGLDAEMVLTYTHQTPRRRLTIVEALKALDGYEYQSCEHPEWHSSAAKAFTERLRRQLIGCLPGYAEADTWSIG